MRTSKFKTGCFRETRTRLGLSQEQLAEQLGISRSALSMAEYGRRNLPVAALLKLAQLEIKMAAAMVTATAITAKETNITIPPQTSFESIQIRELQCELQIQKLSNLLQTMTIQYKKYDTQLRLLDAILEKESDEPTNVFSLSLQLQRDQVRRQLSRCGPTEQSLLRNRIALLGAETHLNKSVRQRMM